ncbi:MAG TPA: hypothetical protein VK633_07420, partial [Verrucomicrobiae bacterium]|nr:hypothetical protein [Verrucomicrobiae bacterium]
RQPEVASVFAARSRRFAERAVVRGSNPSPEQLQAANNLVTSSLQHIEVKDYWWYTLAIYCQVLACLGFVAVGMSLLFRFNPILKLFGLVVVCRAGTQAGRLRLAWRSFLAWLPILVAGCFSYQMQLSHFGEAAQGWDPAVFHPFWPFMVRTVLILVTAGCGILFARISPARGLQEYGSGTFLVPR